MKKTYMIAVGIVLFIAGMIGPIYVQHAVAQEEPLSVDPERSKQDLIGRPVPEAFERLKQPVFLVDETLLNDAVSVAFVGREKNAIDFAVNTLRSPRVEVVDGKRINRTDDFYVAKKIFQQFSQQAIKTLEKEYGTANAMLRGNIIQMLGIMKAEIKAETMLLDALEDDSFSEEEDPEAEGKPMRVCDEAYNQLVLRYEVQDVLRSIGPVHKIDVRDYHIDILKGKLAGLR